MRSNNADNADRLRSTHRPTDAFEQYVSGLRTMSGSGIVFFLECADHVDEVQWITRPSDVVIAPGATTMFPDRRTIGYRGAFIEPGDEMTLDGGQAFELEDYLGAASTSIVRPTVVRQASAEGVAAFFRDADTARHSGSVVDHLVRGVVLLDSLASFVRTGSASDALVRVHVTVNGEYRDGPDGLRLGNVGDGRAEIEASAAAGAGRGRAFARIVNRRVLEADLDDRPWLKRYVAALDQLRQRGGSFAVTGDRE